MLSFLGLGISGIRIDWHILGNGFYSTFTNVFSECEREFLCHLVPWPSIDIHEKFYGDRPRGTPPSWEGRRLKARGVAKYSDFGPIEGYISETVQDRKYVTINH